MICANFVLGILYNIQIYYTNTICLKCI